jgi:hypothetical protein
MYFLEYCKKGLKMPKLIQPLSDIQIKKSQSKEKEYRLFDGGGLIVLIFPDGRKRWRLEYTFDKKRNSLSLGSYPEVSLKEARKLKAEIKKKIKDGINPSSRALGGKNYKNTFQKIALEYFEIREDLSEKYVLVCMKYLNKDIFPFFGDRLIDNILPLEMLEVLQRIDKRGVSLPKNSTI